MNLFRVVMRQLRSRRTVSGVPTILAFHTLFGVFLSIALFPSARTVFGGEVVDAFGGQYLIALLWSRTVAFTLLFLLALVWRNVTFAIALFALRIAIDLSDYVASVVIGFMLDPAGAPLQVIYGAMPLFADIAPGAGNLILHTAIFVALLAPPTVGLALLLPRWRAKREA